MIAIIIVIEKFEVMLLLINRKYILYQKALIRTFHTRFLTLQKPL